MLLGAAALIAPPLAVFIHLTRSADDGPFRTLWRLALAIVIGPGLAALAWGVLLWLSSGRLTLALILDLCIWSAVALAGLIRPRTGATTRPVAASPWSLGTIVSCAIFGLLTLAAGVWFYAQATLAPHGGWDGWAIWNLKARFIARGVADGTWMNLFDPAIVWSHPDYPLLVPLLVARVWCFSGTESVLVPIGHAAAASGLVVAVITLSIARSRDLTRGFWAGMFVVASPVFVKYAPLQYADIPLALFILATLVLAAESERRASTSYACLSGLAAGLALWTKNEGAVFYLLACVLIVAQRPGAGARGARLAAFFAGSAPAVLLYALFKLVLAPESDMLNDRTLLLERFTDVQRVTLVVKTLAREVWKGGASDFGVLPALAVFLLFIGPKLPRERSVLAGAGVLVALLVSYVCAYVITPHNLRWHLSTSVDRLVLHVLPGLVWVGLMLSAAPRSGASAAGSGLELPSSRRRWRSAGEPAVFRLRVNE